MNDPILFKINQKKMKLKQINASSVELEKDIQTLVENNLEEIFGISFLASEYRIDNNNRIDTLGIDIDYGAPVIIEYKRNRSGYKNAVNQGLLYIDLLKEHKEEFKKLVTNELSKDDAENIEWDNATLLCIAYDFNKFDKNAVERTKDRDDECFIELIKYKKYSDMISFEVVSKNHQSENTLQKKHE